MTYARTCQLTIEEVPLDNGLTGSLLVNGSGVFSGLTEDDGSHDMLDSDWWIQAVTSLTDADGNDVPHTHSGVAIYVSGRDVLNGAGIEVISDRVDARLCGGME